MSYTHKFVVRCDVRGVEHEWNGTAWVQFRGTRHDDHASANAALDAARLALPADAVRLRVATEAYLPSREHGKQMALTGLRPFRVLPGGVVPGGSDL